MKTYKKFLVPIIIGVGPGSDHEVTLCGALGFMEDQIGDLYADVMHAQDLGIVKTKDLPEQLK